MLFNKKNILKMSKYHLDKDIIIYLQCNMVKTSIIKSITMITFMKLGQI